MTDSADSPRERLVRVEREGGVGWLVLDDPAAMNALSPVLAAQFVEGLYDLARDCRAIAVTGAGRAFCAGARLSGGIDPTAPGYDAGLALEMHFNPMIVAIASLPLPVVACVNGVAAGGGMALALACDMVVASDAARFVPAFARLGLAPDCGISQVLVEAVGRIRAAEILMLGDAINAADAAALGIVNRVFPAADFEPAAAEFLRRIAIGPTVALGLTKGLLRAANVADALDRERSAQRIAGATSDFREGLDAFLARRDPRFEGR